MAFSWRQGIVFGMGLLLGVMAGAVVLLAWKDSEVQAKAGAQVSAQQLAAAASGPACAFDPLLPVMQAGDGRFAPPAELGDKTTTDILAYVGVGGNAAASGRVRDAEVALITACRIAAQVAGAQSVELADTKYELARHYTAVAAASPAADANRAELLKRAETLYAQSMELYAARFGRPHEKARLAAAGLTLARRAGAMAGALQQAAAMAASGATEVGAGGFGLQPAASAAGAAPGTGAPAAVAGAEGVKPDAVTEPTRSAEAQSESTKAAESRKLAQAAKTADSTKPAQTKVAAPDTSVMGAPPEVRKPRTKPRVEIEEPSPPRSAAAAPGTGWTDAPARSETPPGPLNSLPDEY